MHTTHHLDDYCPCCNAPLLAIKTVFKRAVEYLTVYPDGKPPTDTGGDVDSNAEITVLDSAVIGDFCDSKCARARVPGLLAERGLNVLPPDHGLMETCAQCGGVVYMNLPHVAYVTLDVMEMGGEADVYDWFCWCVVCNRCDGDLAAEEWQMLDDERLLDTQSKMTIAR